MTEAVQGAQRGGPQRGVTWIYDDASRVKAKQEEMLQVDLQAFKNWESTMRDLMALNLSDEEFTTRRLEQLKVWTRRRKRDQYNIHYKYDPSRRDPQLVRRDVNRQLAAMRKRLDEVTARLNAAGGTSD